MYLPIIKPNRVIHGWLATIQAITPKGVGPKGVRQRGSEPNGSSLDQISAENGQILLELAKFEIFGLTT